MRIYDKGQYRDMTAEEIAAAQNVPESEPNEIDQLKVQNTKLEEMLAQTNADFAGFMDYYFAANPE